MNGATYAQVNEWDCLRCKFCYSILLVAAAMSVGQGDVAVIWCRQPRCFRVIFFGLC